MAEKTVAFIVARLGSSRMPGKHFRSIGDRSMIQWIIDQLKTCREIDEIVIATAAGSENDALREYAESQGVSCFSYTGEIDQVTTRLCKAAEYHHADICVMVSGDCPLIYGPAIDQLLTSFQADTKANVLQIKRLRSQEPPALYGVEIARRDAWCLADELSDRPELKEHHFPIIGIKKELFRIHTCFLTENLYAPLRRLSVDTLADLQFLNEIYRELTQRGESFVLPNVLELLNELPELLIINKHVYQRQLKEDIKNVLIIVDAGSSFGYGHLKRSMELGLQIVERLSWPVLFMVDDEYAAEQLESCGFKTIYGALQRLSQKGGETDFNDTVLQQVDLAIIDITARAIQPSYRSGILARIPVVIVDKMEAWCQDAELVVIPGVTAHPEHVCRWNNCGTRPQLIAGKEYVILRRDLRPYSESNPQNQYDVLLYLHDSKLRERILDTCLGHGLRVNAVDGTCENFPLLLARSNYYIGGFGYSFYEALSCNTFPIVADADGDYGDDVKLFYKTLLNIPSGVVPDLHFIKKIRKNIPERALVDRDCIGDGTPEIVKEIAGCLRNFLRKELN